jgi:DNA-directed RNA polymerase specialized sigma24 family protein
MMMSAELDRLRRALEAMPDTDRQVFNLARFDGLEYPAIADRLCLTMQQVEEHMAQAMLHLVQFEQAR